MKKDLNLVKFNLTPEMSLELIKFNELKKELNKLKELYNLDKSDDLLLQIQEKEKKLNDSRENFIKEFRINNREEIMNYLKIKDLDN